MCHLYPFPLGLELTRQRVSEFNFPHETTWFPSKTIPAVANMLQFFLCVFSILALLSIPYHSVDHGGSSDFVENSRHDIDHPDTLDEQSTLDI